MAVEERRFTFGTRDGTPFDVVKNIRSIAFRSGSYIDAIIINGMHFGGTGGSLSKTLHIDPGDYISRIFINSGAVVDYIQLETNDGQNLIVGGEDGDYHGVLEGKVTGFSGKTGYLLHGPPLLICRLTVWIETAQHQPN